LAQYALPASVQVDPAASIAGAAVRCLVMVQAASDPSREEPV
jgi:hypothetical protein